MSLGGTITTKVIPNGYGGMYVSLDIANFVYDVTPVPSGASIKIIIVGLEGDNQTINVGDEGSLHGKFSAPDVSYNAGTIQLQYYNSNSGESQQYTMDLPALSLASFVQSTDLVWQTANMTQSGTTFIPTDVGAYTNIAYADLGTSGCVYATVTFPAFGYVYAGLSQTMTTTDPVGQHVSKIDAGFKVDANSVRAVYNGSEYASIGIFTQSFTVIRRSSQFEFYVDGSLIDTRLCQLQNGNTYRLAVASYDAPCQIVGGTYDETLNITAPGVPGAPSVAFELETDKINITLVPPASDGNEQLSYNIYLQGPTDESLTKISETVKYPNNVFKYSLPSGYPFGLYNVQVSAYNSAGESDYGQSVAVYVGPPPPAPTNVILTKTSYNSLSVSWTAPTPVTGGGSITSYKLRMKLDGTDLPDVTSITETSYTLVSLPAGSYTADVIAVDYYGLQGVAGASSNSVTISLPTSPGAPSSVSFSLNPSIEAAIDVSWTAPEIGIDQDPVIIYSVVLTDSLGGTGTLTTSATTVTFENLVTGTTYLAPTVTVIDSFSQSGSPVQANGLPITITGGGKGDGGGDGGGGGGGDGGDGGGGNNGGNGHNNMATIEFSYAGYEGDVSQTNTITVLGEEGGALTADETIVVKVSPEKLQKVLKYDSKWSSEGDAAGEQPLPKVKFSPSAATVELNAMFEKLKVKGTGAAGSSGRKWQDDTNADIPVFGDELLGLTFTNSALDDDELPREAIRKVEEGDITADSIMDVVVDLSTEVAPATGKPAHKALLEGMFEQAVSAGRVTTLAVKDTDDFKKVEFVAGDSLSFLVKYNFSKTREYDLDTDVTSGNTTTGARTSITIGSVTFNIDTGSETSDAYSKTYMIKLLAE